LELHRLILLDTNALLWYLAGDPLMSKKALAVIEAEEQTDGILAISTISLYEVAYLVKRNKVIINISIDLYLDKISRAFTLLPITPPIAVKAASLPKGFPKDPADRIIGATAIVGNLTLLTSDGLIRKSPLVKTVW
jgi:PIN domain nuclease of toxin-antitoxin system